MDSRYIVFYLLIMIKGISKAYNPAGTFLLPLSNLFYHHFTEHGDIAFFAYNVSPYGYRISSFICLFEPTFIY